MKVGYARVSTGSKEQQQALPVQISILQQQGCDRVLSDIESGLNPQRTSYQELRRLIAAGQVVVGVEWRI